MIRFEEPLRLLLAVPWLAFWWAFARVQRRACGWVWEHVAERFRRRFTVSTPANLRRHLSLPLGLGLLLVFAAARPTLSGGEVVREVSGRVVLLLDASASMRATDGGPPPSGSGNGETRFERSRRLARELIARLPGYRFALVTFSGVATLELPLSADPASLEEALRVVEHHTFYRNTGSDFGAALDRVLHFFDEERGDLQALIFSDGEQPYAQSYAEPLAALAEADVPVHAVAVGSTEGQARVIYDFRDIVAEKENPSVLREYTTRRQDRHLRRIARTTGGAFTVAEGETADDEIVGELTAAIAARQGETESVTGEGRRDLGPVLLVLVLVLQLLDAAVHGRRAAGRGRGAESFEVGRIVRSAVGSARRVRGGVGAVLVPLGALALTAAAGCAGGPGARASRENERGIAADAAALWGVARTHYERSAAYGVASEIPLFNLARSLTLQGDYSEAHDLYQRALELTPDLAPAHENDGHALYLWGEAERDPEGCRLQRTLELWAAARRRFADAAALYPPEEPGAERARRNLRFLAERIAAIGELAADPPPECLEEGGAAGGGGGEAQGGGGGGRGGGEPGPAMGGEGGGAGGGNGGGSEAEQIAEAFDRLRRAAASEGKYHRRSRAEQFPSEAWKNPDREIWW